MHHPNSPHYEWDRMSIGWLHSKHANGEPVYEDEVRRIYDADPSTETDPLMMEYCAKAFLGKLKRLRGRPPLEKGRWFKVLLAQLWIEDRAKEIAAERRLNGIRDRTLEEPAFVAANEVSRWMKFHKSGAALRNEISSQKIHAIFPEVPEFQ